jgi:hypothetical protein
MLQNNNLNGTAEHVCGSVKKPQVFSADCEEIMNCSCCTTCCYDQKDVEHCKDDVWMGGIDPIWENKYERAFYQFDVVKLQMPEH